jgi:hypothetical protein
MLLGAAHLPRATRHLGPGAHRVWPVGCVAGDLTITGNGVEHQTVNNAGHFWMTATLTGTATDAAARFTGRATAWFGVEGNKSNFTSSFIAEAIGTLTNGTALDINENGTFTVNAQGNIIVNRSTATCS